MARPVLPSSVTARALPALVVALLAFGSLRAAAEGSAGLPPPPARLIRGMRYPAISPDGSRIAFSFRGDLWTVSSQGGEARRVAALPGWDTRPRWSPDGKTLAFCSDVNGNTDLYTIPAEGGTPRQVTFHTGEDYLGDWSPDGKSLLFYSARDTRYPVIYSVGLQDGRLRELVKDEIPLQSPAFSPDGQWVAYTRGTAGWARKGYHGSANGDIWLASLSHPGQIRRITTYPGNDLWPMFSGDGKWIYFASDQDGTGNIWKEPAAGGKPVSVTRQKVGYVHYPAISRDGRMLVYETDFSLWTVDLAHPAREPQRLEVRASVTDEPKLDTRKLTNGADEIEVSPDGSQLALGIRGDIFVVPAGGGEARRLTDSVARDHSFSWSPDGRRLVYVSEREANSDLYDVDVASGATRRLTTDPDPDTAPAYSPDGSTIAFLRGAGGNRILTIPAAGGAERVVVQGGFLGEPRWSPDSRWLAYSRRTLAGITNVYVTPVGSGGEVNVSHWTGSNSQPAWSPDGKRLSFLSNRSGTGEIYTVELSRPRPAAAMGGSGAVGAGAAVAVDAMRIDRRVRQLVAQPSGSKSGPVYTPDGKRCLFSVFGPGPSVWSVPVEGGNGTKVAEGIGGTLRLTRDGATLFALSPSSGLVQKLSLSGGSPSPVPYSATLTVDLMEERRQAFDQAWRLLHDNFYDPRMHGVDWTAVRARYRPVVNECTDLSDFHLLLTEMVGELNASHMGVQHTREAKVPNETGQLGLWFDWSREGPGLKVSDVLIDGPADVDESRIRPGEYVMAVAGKDAVPSEELFRALAGQSGKAVELLVNTRPSKEGARTVRLTPVPKTKFSDLLYDHWVQRNREAVARLSGGKLAYLHIRNMDPASLQRFERELLTDAYDREGLVLDVRFNPGGRIHDELFGLLARRVHAYETPRDGLKMTQPFGAFTRPMVLLINPGSASDSEIFANGFREQGLGKIIGVPTNGAVIGTTNLPLLDGLTTFRVPRTGWQDLAGRNLENYGVPPDVSVDFLPADAAAGRDPQLETAVRELQKQLQKRGSKTKR